MATHEWSNSSICGDQSRHPMLFINVFMINISNSKIICNATYTQLLYSSDCTALQDLLSYDGIFEVVWLCILQVIGNKGPHITWHFTGGIPVCDCLTTQFSPLCSKNVILWLHYLSQHPRDTVYINNDVRQIRNKHRQKTERHLISEIMWLGTSYGELNRGTVNLVQWRETNTF